jgi:hypothetical protein
MPTKKSVTAAEVLGLVKGDRCTPQKLVQSYRNLNKPGVVYSIRSKATGLVIGYEPRVTIDDARLRVQEGGRQRVLREQRKNVHAFVEGCWHEKGRAPKPEVRVRYNPYLFSSFVRGDTLEPVHEADEVLLDQDGAWARRPR